MGCSGSKAGANASESRRKAKFDLNECLKENKMGELSEGQLEAFKSWWTPIQAEINSGAASSDPTLMFMMKTENHDALRTVFNQ